MHLSDQQRAAIETPKNRVIVSAQAGAGKTEVFVRRILREIQQGASLDQMLIVTFTKKAASEMRRRIREKLQALLRERPDRRIYRQLNLLNSANIQTLHAFCLEILRENFDLLDRDPRLRILSGRQIQQIKDQALEETLEKVYAGQKTSPQILAFFDAYINSDRRSDQEIKELILSLAALASREEKPERWAQETLKKMEDPAFFDHLGRAYLEREILPEIDRILRYLSALDQVAWEEVPEKVASFMTQERAEVLEVLFGPDRAASEDLDLLYGHWKKQAFLYSWGSFPGLREKTWGEGILWKERIQSLRKAYKGLLQDLEKKWARAGFLSLDVQRRTLLDHLHVLLDLYLDYKAALDAGKLEAKGLEFDDIEELMLELLAQEEPLAKLRRRYRYIFFDEYQDANGRQEKIVNTLAGPETKEFFVGDVKQSIYSFRRAEPENFLRRYQAYLKDPQADALDMTVNFRAAAHLPDFLNRIFASLMTEKRGEINYDSPAHRAVTKEEAWAQPGGQIHFLLLKEDAKKIEKTSYLDEIPAQAFLLARQIQAYLAEDPAHRYSDITVLFRTNAPILQQKKVFAYLGIPYVADQPAPLEASLEYEFAVHFLSFLDNGRRDLPLLATLLSLVGGFREEELAEIRTLAPEESFTKAFSLAAKEGEEDRLGAACRHKIARLLERRRNWRRKLREMPLSEWIHFVFEDSGLFRTVRGMEEGELREGHLLEMLALAKEYEAGEAASLSGYLDYLQTKISSDGENTNFSPSQDPENAVSMMTIHQAKGLTLPVVFLANLERNFSSPSPTLLYQEEALLALDIRRVRADGRLEALPSIQRALALSSRKDKDRMEEVRILYVALSRAVQRLYLFSTMKKWEEVQLDPLQDLQELLDQDQNYAAWIGHILSASQEKILDQASFSDLIQEAKAKEEKAEDPRAFSLEKQAADGSFSFSVVSEGLARSDIQRGKERKEKKIPPRDPRLLQLLFQEERPLPAKMTVSAISRKNRILEDHFEDWPRWKKAQEEALPKDLRLPNFLAEEKLSASAFGSLIHRVLQLLPLKAYTEASLEEGLDDLEARFLLTKAERKQVDSRLLLPFYQSQPGLFLLAHADQVERERSFTMRYQLEDGQMILVDGQVDLYLVLEDGILLLDFKTDRSRRPWAYRDQLALYTRALTQAYHKPIRAAYLYWVRFGQADQLDLS